jgi:hypothetical protein
MQLEVLYQSRRVEIRYLAHGYYAIAVTCEEEKLIAAIDQLIR